MTNRARVLSVGIVFVVLSLAWLTSGERTRSASEPDDVPGRSRREPRAIDAPIPRVGSADAGVSLSSCDHPYIPHAVGERRAYELTVSTREGERGSATMSVVEATDGAVLWETALAAPGLSGARTIAGSVNCDSEGAEEPWFAGAMPGLRVEGRWRWPSTLDEGVRFAGTARFVRPDGSAVSEVRQSRDHTVLGFEERTVPAGTFGTWHVHYDEQTETTAGTARASGDVWVAREIGLVESRVTSDGVETRWRLTEVVRP